MPVSLTRCSRITSIKNLTLACAVTLVTCRALAAPAAATAPPLLLQHPSMSATDIAFDYAGEIWTVPREGGLARRLVSGLGRVPRPVFSPDGSLIAYTGVYDGNSDVYVVSATGGEPTRLTYHPDEDVALGFTPDGKEVLSWSPRGFCEPPFGGSEPRAVFHEALSDPALHRAPATGTR